MSVQMNAPPPPPEVVEKLNRAFADPNDDLSILDQLAVPKKFDDLVMQIQARDCRMFFPMVGLPRAYMEFPVPTVPIAEKTLARSIWGGNPDHNYERWVYSVFAWHAKGTRSRTESLLCEAVWKDFVAMRKEFHKLYGGMEPLIIWRRLPEFETQDELKSGPCFEHGRGRCKECHHGPRCLVQMRFHIPGLRTGHHPHADKDSMDRWSSRFEVVPEPRT